MTLEQILTAFGPSALPAIAMLWAVKVMLKHQAEQMRAEREHQTAQMEAERGAHEDEINKLLKVFIAMVKVISPAATDDLLTELEDMVDDT